MAGKIQTGIITIFIFIIFSFLGNAITFSSDQPSQLCHAVRVDNGIASGVLCNVTVLYPNSTVFIDFQKMDDTGDRFCFNLTAQNNSVKGEYNYEITCLAPNGNNNTLSSSYIVNLGGVEPSQSRTDTTTRTIYIMFIIGILLFVSFLITKPAPVKWTFFLLSMLFFLIAFNFLFLSLQDEIVNSRMESFFSSFTSISFILYLFIAFLVAAIWLLTVFVTIFQKMQDSKARRMSAYG
jgi:hypothetical protein